MHQPQPSRRATAANRHEAADRWHADASAQMAPLYAQQAQELGITAADVARLQASLAAQTTSYQQVFGLSRDEMAAMA